MADNGDTVTLRALAKEIGKSHVWVLKLINAGIIPRNEDGTIPHRAALEAYQAHIEARDAGKPQTAARPAGKQAAPMADIDEAVNVGMSYNKAKAAKETYTAQLRGLELKTRKGELVEKKEVELMATALAEKVRGKLMTVGVRIAGLCEGRTAREIEELIDTEINSAMADLRKDWLKDV